MAIYPQNCMFLRILFLKRLLAPPGTAREVLPMNDQQIRCFLAVTDCMNFTAAAKKLYLSQAAISRNISSLERELGLSLFQRDSKSVVLLPAGEIMRDAFININRELKQAEEKAQSAVSGVEGELKLGFLEGQLLDDTIIETIRIFEARYPKIRVQLIRGNYRTIMDDVHSGLDIIEMPIAAVKCMLNVEYETVCMFETLIIMPKGHKLAGSENLTLRDFSGDTFVIPSEEELRGSAAALQSRCRSAGFDPKILTAQDVKAQQLMVETGKGLAIANHNHLMANSSAVISTTVPEYPPEEFVIAWSRKNSNHLVSVFRRILKYVSEKRNTKPDI